MPDTNSKNPEEKDSDDSVAAAVERLRRIFEADRPGPAAPAPPTQPGAKAGPPPADADSAPPTKPSPQSDKSAPESQSQSPPSASHPTPTPTPPIQLRKVKLDRHDMPLPPRVPERDPHATRVAPSTPYLPPRQPAPPPPDAPPIEGAARPRRAHPPPGRPRSARLGKAWKIVQWLIAVTAFVTAATILLAGVYVAYRYVTIARTLPPTAADLYNQATAQFQTTRIYDRSGRPLYELLDPNAGRRTAVPLSKISPYLVAATIATEDRNFYNDPGFDARAIVRALLQNTREGETVSGASTITQQLVRALLLSPEERGQRTYERKVREIVFAVEINRLYTKDEILELYLDEIYYGNLAYGIEAASETYFKKPASDLTLPEAALLAGLPQAPAIYDPYTNKAAVLARMESVLALMIAASGDCSQPGRGIYVSNSPDRICVTPESAGVALSAMSAQGFEAASAGLTYPHFVNYVRALLENTYGAQEIYRAGFNVYTTIDPQLQDLAQKAVSDQVAALAAQNVKDGALVAIRPATGEILAMVGSPDYDNVQIDGQINMAVSPRQPGSSIKPYTYLAAFEKGWTPATLIWDVPSDFPDGANPPYRPVNYDGRFRGPVLVRDALASSYNVPAVKALQYVGVYDNPDTPEKDGLIAFAERLGVTTLTRPDYGLALTLGGGEVTLLEHTGAYAIFANNGVRMSPVAILRITDSAGNTRCEQPLSPGTQSPAPSPCQTLPENWGRQVVRPAHATLITSILSDNEARSPSFGPSSALNAPYPAAVKTGTTNDYRDNWTMGYTTQIAVGVWVGNADYTPLINSTGLTGAAPIWRAFVDAAAGLQGYEPQPFARASDLVEKVICAPTGAEPGRWCEGRPQRIELFAYDQLPLPADRDVIRKFYVDTFSGLRANPLCPDRAEEKGFVDVADPFAVKWLETNLSGQQLAANWGIELPVKQPPAECTADTPRPILAITSPAVNAAVSGRVRIEGQAGVTKDFDHYVVDYGLGADPQGWGSIAGPNTTPAHDNGLLAEWDTGSLNEPVTIRVTVFDKAGHSADIRAYVNVNNGTATPEPTATESPTLEPSETAPPSETGEAPTATLELPTQTVEPPTATLEPPTATTEPLTETPASSP